MLSARQILEATGGSIITYDNEEPREEAQLREDILFSGLSIDSRTIRQGELFLAIKGDRYDGHDFVQDALKTGAGAIISRGRRVRVAAGKSTILVDDTLSALHAIAHSIRKQFGGSVIGVVGSFVLGSLAVRIHAALPHLDATLMSYSLVASWWGARKHIANWWLWIAVDIIYVGEYLYKDMWPTAVLYAGLVVLAVLGLRDWRRAAAVQMAA